MPSDQEMNAWQKAHLERQKKLERLPEIRRELANKISAAGYKTVQLDFSGSGDSGNYDGIQTDGEYHFFSYSDKSRPDIFDELEEFADLYLETTNVDWYNNDGGQGYIKFDVSVVPFVFECSIDQNYTSTYNAHYEEEVA